MVCNYKASHSLGWVSEKISWDFLGLLRWLGCGATPYGEKHGLQGKVIDEEKENVWWLVMENDDEEKENVCEERVNDDEGNHHHHHGEGKENDTYVVSESVWGFLFLWDCDDRDHHHHLHLGCNY